MPKRSPSFFIKYLFLFPLLVLTVIFLANYIVFAWSEPTMAPPQGGGSIGLWSAGPGFIYNSTGNVGIGTNNPGVKMDVAGSVRANGSPSPSWGDVIGGSFNTNTTYAYNSICVNNSSGTCGSTGGVVLGLSNTDALTNIPTSGNTFFNNGGNVGIGTISPGHKLDITGNVRATGEIISTLGSGYGQLRLISGNYGSMFRNDGNNTYLLFTASGNQYGAWNSLRPLIINNASGDVSINNGSIYSRSSDGWVGIGTVSPQGKFDVPGNVYSYFGNLRLNGLDANVNQIWQSNPGATLGITAQGGNISFGQTYTQQMIIRPSGNVGIGTANPGYKLDVAGDINYSGLLRKNGQPVSLSCVTRTGLSHVDCLSDETIMGGSCSNFNFNHFDFPATSQCIWNITQQFTQNGFTCAYGSTYEYNCYVRETNPPTASARCCKLP